MGTRSVVAVRSEDGTWRGRYVHWDGYPSGVGDAVRAIVERDGREQAVQVLTQDHYGWSSVDGAEHQELSRGKQDGRFVAVPGYGVAYTEEDGASSDDWFSEDTLEDSWVDYVHVIELDGTVVSFPA